MNNRFQTFTKNDGARVMIDLSLVTSVEEQQKNEPHSNDVIYVNTNEGGGYVKCHYLTCSYDVFREKLMDFYNNPYPEQTPND